MEENKTPFHKENQVREGVQTELTGLQHVAMSAFWCGSNVVWGALLGIIMPKAAEMIAGPESKAGFLGTTLGLGALIALGLPLLVGGMSDRCTSKWGRRRPYIFAGTLMAACGLALMYQSIQHTVSSLFVISYIVVQVGSNISNSAYSGVIPDLVPPHQRGLASGYMAFMSQIGTLLGIGGSGYLITFNHLLAFLCIGGLMVFTMLITLVGIKEKTLPKETPKIHWPSYLKSLWIDPRQYPDFAWVWVTRFFVMLGFYSVQPYLQYYLKDVIQVEDPLKTMSLMGVTILLSAMLSGFLGGMLSDRIGKKRVVYIANGMIALISTVFVFLRTLEQTYVAAIFFGLGYGAYISVDWALGTSVLPTKTNAAKEMAIWHIAMTLPQMLGTPFVGLLLEYFGTTSVRGEIAYTHSGYTAMFMSATLFFILGTLGLRNVKQTS